MINRRQIILSIIYFFALTNIPIALCATQQVNVTGDGTSDYKCDGITITYRLTKPLVMLPVIQVQEYILKGLLFMT